MLERTSKIVPGRESGQALVLVLLSLSVVLTIVLYVLSRSVTDISTSTEQENSVRAFSAAEAGVETALITGMSASGVLVGDASYSVEVSEYGAGSQFNYPETLMSGDEMTIWFVSHDSDGDMTCNDGNCFTGNRIEVCWGSADAPSDTSMTPAVGIDVYYETSPGNLSTVQIARAMFDPNAGRTSSNMFDVSGGACQIDGVNYAFHKEFLFSDLDISSYGVAGGLLFAKVTMLYNEDVGHLVGVNASFDSNSPLPSQGKDIVSTGTYGTSGSESHRRVNVFQGWSEFPFSDFSIYYPYGIEKGS